jgi:5-methylcytosine-specific restriction endonuclease McrA
MIGGRCVVLNASYEFLHVTKSWFDSIKLVTRGKARSLTDYEDSVKSECMEVRIPAVVVLNKFVRTPKKIHYFNAATKRNVLIRDGFACMYCGKKLTMNSVTKDHIQPTSRGGKDVLSNVVASCIECNGFKANRTPEEAGMRLRSQPRALTEIEKMELLVKTHKSIERNTWRSCFEEHALTLF